MRLFLCFFLCLGTLVGHAQLQPGTLLLSGSRSFVSGPPQLVTTGVIGGAVGGDDVNGFSQNFSGFRMAPSVGVAVSRALVVGGRIEASSTWIDGERYGQATIAPFGRYYFGSDEATLLPFGELQVGYANYGASSGDSFFYGLAAGVAYRLNGQVSLESSLFYNEEITGSALTNIQRFGLQLGLTSFLSVADRGSAEAAPFGAGDWIIGTSGLQLSSEKFFEQRQTNIGAQPSVQYLLSDNLAVGGIVEFSHFRSSEEFGSRASTISVGPTARYYFGAPRRRPFFAALGMQYVHSQSTDYFLFGSGFPDPTPAPSTRKSSGLQFGLACGQQLFLTDKLALEYGPRIGFYRSLDDVELATRRPVRINLEIGLQYFL